MSGLIILHKPYQEGDARFLNLADEYKCRLWQTCRREVLFLSEDEDFDFSTYKDCKYYSGIHAEAFLIEILCGLKSPLIGETEVFGQFKTWWQNLQSKDFQRRFETRIQNIYSTVKRIREENLCGIGSHSYGSLLRKKIENQSDDIRSKVSFVGAGQLTSEILPWVQEKWGCRIWCRKPDIAQEYLKPLALTEICHLTEDKPKDSNLLVVAAPIGQGELESWIGSRFDHKHLVVYDFRRDSMHINWKINLKDRLHLDHLTYEFSHQQKKLSEQAGKALNDIRIWAANESKKAQLRPFGWDDL